MLAFRSNSLTLLFHFTDVTCSSKVSFIEENVGSAIHLMPYSCFFFHRFLSLSCCITTNFLGIHPLAFVASNSSPEEKEKIKGTLTRVDKELRSLGGILKIAAPWAQLLVSLLPR